MAALRNCHTLSGSMTVIPEARSLSQRQQMDPPSAGSWWDPAPRLSQLQVSLPSLAFLGSGTLSVVSDPVGSGALPLCTVCLFFLEEQQSSTQYDFILT